MARRLPLLLLLALAASGVAVALEVPYLSGPVVDLADLLPAGSEARLDARLRMLEQEEGAQVAVLTIPSLEGEVIEDYSLRVAETWALGRGEFDDGVLLLIARDDRQMRIEVGYGLEGTIPDVAAGRIIDGVLSPRFREGDFGGGVEEAVDVIARLIAGEDALPPPAPTPQRQRTDRPGATLIGFLMTVGFFSLIAVSSRGCFGLALFLFLTPWWFSVPLQVFGSPIGYIIGVLWVVGFPILWAKFSGKGGGTPRSGGGSWSSGSGWGSFSSGGGGFSSGGFSGGGGSFGGGGASGSW
jgi:uncharacterized protein